MGKTTVTIRLTASLPYRTYQKEGWENARCDLLKVQGIGKSKRSAIKNLKDSITLLIQGAMEDKTLDVVLKDCGFKKSNPAGVPVWETGLNLMKKFADQERLEFNATLRVRIADSEAILPEGEYRSVNPVVITATSSMSSAGGLST